MNACSSDSVVGNKHSSRIGFVVILVPKKVLPIFSTILHQYPYAIVYGYYFPTPSEFARL